MFRKLVVFSLTCLCWFSANNAYATCGVIPQLNRLPAITVQLYRNTARGLMDREVDLAHTYGVTPRLVLLYVPPRTPLRNQIFSTFESRIVLRKIRDNCDMMHGSDIGEEQYRGGELFVYLLQRERELGISRPRPVPVLDSGAYEYLLFSPIDEEIKGYLGRTAPNLDLALAQVPGAGQVIKKLGGDPEKVNFIGFDKGIMFSSQVVTTEECEARLRFGRPAVDIDSRF